MYSRTFFSRGVAVLLCLTIGVAALYFGRTLFVPLFTALLLACIVLPAVRNLEALRWPRWLAAFTSVSMVVGVTAAVMVLLWVQLGGFYRNIDELLVILNQQVAGLQRFADGPLSMPAAQSEEWLRTQKFKLIEWVTRLTFNLLGARENAVTRALLIPFFMFFALMYRYRLTHLLLHFRRERAAPYGDDAFALAHKIASHAQHYVRGVLTVALIVWVAAAACFRLIGLEYAILGGLIVAVFNIIPYIGFLLGALFPLLTAIMQHAEPSLAVAVLAICLFLHLLDVNLLQRRLLADCVTLNPLAIMLALIAGGLLWGLVGMVLSVLLASVLKLVLDHLPAGRPFGYLLGEETDYGGELPPRTRLWVP